HLVSELPPSVDDRLRIGRAGKSHRAERHRAEAMSGWKAGDAEDGVEPHHRVRSASLFAAQELVDLVLDLLKVHEGAVDGGKANISHLVEATELIHHQLAHFTRWNVNLAPGSQLRLDLVHDPFDGAVRDLALGGGLHQAAEELLAIEVLPAAIRLPHVERPRLDALVGGEALGALQALAAPADRFAGVRVPGIDHL